MSTGGQTSIILEHHVSYGHRLKDSTTKCRFLHGHTGIITAKIRGKVNEISGMVTDFGPLKAALKKFLDDTYDHTMILEQWDKYVEIFREDEQRLIVLATPPTTEIIAARMRTWIQCILDKEFNWLSIISLKLEETPSNIIEVEN